jgi:hypothetical protein
MTTIIQLVLALLAAFAKSLFIKLYCEEPAIYGV